MKSKVLPAISLFSLFAAYGPTFDQETIWERQIHEAARLVSKREYAAAEKLYLNALEEAKQSAGSDLRETVTLNNLGLLYRKLARYPEAQSAYERALALCAQVAGTDDPTYARVLTNLGLVFGMTGRYPAAEQALKRALMTRERTLGPSHPDTVDALENLADVYREQGRRALARNAYVKALEFRANAGDNNAKLGVTLSRLAAVETAERRLDVALPLLIRAVEILDRASVPNSALAWAFNVLGVIYQRQRNYAEAERVLRSALGIEDSEDATKPNLDVMLVHNLALVCQETGRPRDAESFWLRALALNEQIFGPDHPHTGVTLANYAVLLRAMKRKAEARRIAARARRILSDSEHANLGSLIADVGELGRSHR